MLDFAGARNRMVDVQLARRGIRHARVLAAMRKVPREAFVEPGMEEFAYEDSPLPIGEGQTISQPYIVALMIEAAELGPGDRVLEVGAGSGYAAAVMAQVAARVFAIERHARLGRSAARRLADLGYRTVPIRIGDGTLGWPEAAPFDAILVAAGGPEPPAALKTQLEIGGRLVVPVGRAETGQELVKLTRTGEATWHEERLGAVRFVPLVGAQGWAEDGSRPAGSHVSGHVSGHGTGRVSGHMPGGPRARSLAELVAEAAVPLPAPEDPGFAAAFDRYADRRVVLLGEASHGTAEFYRARAAITRRLVERHGFGIVAVEADWPDAAAIDRYVRHRRRAAGAEPPFRRFPTWMWRNTEVADFVDWLRGHNAALAPEDRARFHGLDIYNMRGSIAAVLAYLDEVDPGAARVARERYGCLTPWQNEYATYGRAVLTESYAKCEAEVVAQCRDLLGRALEYAAREREGASFLDAAQNARLIAAAERYYRIMYYGGAESWNLRDTHMFETLGHLLEARGPAGAKGAKAVVWAHNSHIGDARATDMGELRGGLNIGQLARERWGAEVALIGFGTHAGTVAAASDWDGAMEVKSVRPSRGDSYERVCHDAGVPRFLLPLGEDGAARRGLLEPRLERFIGVIYRPETELQSHYARACLPEQLDAWVWFDETRAVTPLGDAGRRAGVPDTYPFGV
jgi:protein-L-isoaspartate(D-aspartate) O-methyltransferase